MTVSIFSTLLSQCAEFAASVAPNEIFIGIVGFSWATFLWEEYLAHRQVSYENLILLHL